MSLKYEQSRRRMLMTFSESTSEKLSDFEYEGCWLWGVVPGGGTEVWEEYI
jgi:hypothetical protein